MPDELPLPSERAQEVFFAALERPEPAERAAFLDRECTGDLPLRRWVDQELRRQLVPTDAASPGETDPMPTVLTDGADTTTTPEIEALLASLKPEEPGDTIGVYKLLEPLGEGGFGTVWHAEQSHPVRRPVALKIIRVGMNSREVIARFAQERQALALMDHPNIAKVFDAGATPYGRPFFAMELVRGQPITDYCDAERLPIRQRLELFMQVCYALQHAHQKGIIHRDIKPSNVLVATQDNRPSPKVIDFGIAKATQQERLTEMTLVTRADFLLGTPLYMSPEQAESEGVDIDTRSDIYSLGVLLFVLLAGRTPLDPEVVKQSNFEGLIRLIRDEDLPHPTAVLRRFPAEELREVAAQRGLEPARIVATVRGDLEWICMKALEKDRRRRYAAAGDLARDIQRYLLDEPITARPPSPFYRLGKLAVRHRHAFGAAAAIFFVLILGTFVSLAEALHARAAEAKAVASQASETDQRRRAERESGAARLNEYVANIGLAQQAINSGNLGRASELLQKERPGNGGEGLRDFAWRYLWHLTQGDEHDFFPDQDSPVAALAFSPDGALVAIGGLDEVTICSTSTRRQLASLRPGTGSLGFLPGGKTLVTHGTGRVRLWSTEDWTEQASWPEGSGPLALSADGRRLAIVCRDGVRLRDTATWQELRFLPGSGSPVAFSPDGRTLAASTAAGITLFPLEGEGPGQTLPDSAGLFSPDAQGFFHVTQGLVFSPDGQSLTAPQNAPTERGVFLLRTWDVRSGREAAPMPDRPEYAEHTGTITSVAISPDGSMLATTSLDHSVRLWDLARRVCVAALHGHRAEVRGCAFAPDGRMLATGDRSGYLAAWPLPWHPTVDTLPGIRRPLGFSSDSLTLAAMTSDETVDFYDVQTRAKRQSFPLLPTAKGQDVAVALSADQRRLAQGLDGGELALTDTASGEVRTVRVADQAVDFLALTPDGRRAVFSAPGTPLRVHDLDTGQTVTLPLGAKRAVLSADGRLLAALSPRRAVTILRANGPLVPDQGATEVALAGPPPNSARGSSDLLTLWDLEADVPRATLDVEVRYVLDAAFSPDGKLFAAALSDNTVRLWDAQTGKPLGTCAGHRQIVLSVAFSPDGRTLASASEDGTLRLWNVETQQELLSLQHLGERMTSLSFSTDGRTLAVADRSVAGNGQIRLHRAPSFGETDWELQLEKLK